MTDEDLKEIAHAVAEELLERIEYSDIYEDEELEHLSEGEMQKVHRLVATAQISALVWDDAGRLAA